MRLHERTLRTIRILPRLHESGALGGRAEAFDETGVEVRASVLAEGGTIHQKEKGLADREALRLLVPADTVVAAGDAAAVDGRRYAVRCVERWTAHLELICEASA